MNNEHYSNNVDPSDEINKYLEMITNYPLTYGLFVETSSDPLTVKYTLKDREHKGYPSLKQLYMAAEDLTEYDFAMEYIGSWSNWEKLIKTKWFTPYISRWRKELELKIKARALKAIKDVAELNEGKQALDANKWLLARGWADKTDQSKRGRPSKDEIRQAAFDLADEHELVQQDRKRLETIN